MNEYPPRLVDDLQRPIMKVGPPTLTAGNSTRKNGDSIFRFALRGTKYSASQPEISAPPRLQRQQL